MLSSFVVQKMAQHGQKVQERYGYCGCFGMGGSLDLLDLGGFSRDFTGKKQGEQGTWMNSQDPGIHQDSSNKVTISSSDLRQSPSFQSLSFGGTDLPGMISGFLAHFEMSKCKTDEVFGFFFCPSGMGQTISLSIFLELKLAEFPAHWARFGYPPLLI